MNSLKVSKGPSIAIYSMGAVGSEAFIVARIVVLASPIVAVDIRIRVARTGLRVGRTQVIDNRHDKVASHISDSTGSGVDYAVETTGNWNSRSAPF